MSVMYGQMAAKAAAAKIMAQVGKQKKQYEYDSDEETEGGQSTSKYIFKALDFVKNLALKLKNDGGLWDTYDDPAI